MSEKPYEMNEFDLTRPDEQLASEVDRQRDTLAFEAYVTKWHTILVRLDERRVFELTEAGAAALRDTLSRCLEVIGEYKSGTRKQP